MIRLIKPEIPPVAMEEITAVLESGNLVQGKRVAAFEKSLTGYLGVKHGFAVSSGTAALHLSLLAAGIGPGDEVIVPAFTFPATANAVELTGAKPVLVDIGLDDFCIRCDQIEDVITDATRAIIPVHEFGLTANMKPLMEYAAKFGLKIIEDAACGLGAMYGNDMAGTLGDTGCFSFHPRKALTTGEGGFVATNDDVLAVKLDALRNHGIVRDGSGIDFHFAGLNYRMTDFQAVMGTTQVAMIETARETRQGMADAYTALLRDIPGITVPSAPAGRRHAYQTYHVLLPEGMEQGRVIGRLRQAGIETNLGAQALHCLKFFRGKYGFATEDFPAAAAAYTRGLALPIGGHLADGDIETVVRNLRSIIDNPI